MSKLGRKKDAPAFIGLRMAEENNKLTGGSFAKVKVNLKD
jgi:hypothetical protein